MSKKEWKKRLGALGRVLLAYALIFVQGAWATQNQATKDKSGSPQKAAQQTKEKQSSAAISRKAQNGQAQGEQSESLVAEEKPSPDGSHQSIKVHGHWTIEVRTADGTLVTHHEFENSLAQSTGAPLLANLLNSGGAALNAPFVWLIKVGNNNPLQASTDVCSGTISNIDTTGDCWISQPAPAGVTSLPAQSLNLRTSVSSGSFLLTGTVQASATSNIYTVASEVSVVQPVPPYCIATGGTCPPPFLGPPSQFTSATLATPVVVSNGQTISVSVNISFS